MKDQLVIPANACFGNENCSMILIAWRLRAIARRTAELLARAGHSLRLMTRTPQFAPKLPGSETVRGDFAEPATLTDAFAGTSAALIVSASGEPGERARLHRNAFEAAARAHLEHVVYLSLQEPLQTRSTRSPATTI